MGEAYNYIGYLGIFVLIPGSHLTYWGQTNELVYFGW